MAEAGATTRRSAASIDDAEVAKFAAMAQAWWDPQRKFRPLHRFNPVRLAYIRDRLCARFDRDPNGERPRKGLRLLDVGCGGGLLAVPLARLGAEQIGSTSCRERVCQSGSIRVVVLSL